MYICDVKVPGKLKCQRSSSCSLIVNLEHMLLFFLISVLLTLNNFSLMIEYTGGGWESNVFPSNKVA